VIRRPVPSRALVRRRRIIAVTVAAVIALDLWAGISAIRLAGGWIGSAGSDAVPVDPAAFATGSCIAYAPTHGDNHTTFFLDGGHGGRDPGAVGTTQSGATIEEADETLPVEMDTAALLRARGYRVVVSRTTDASVVRLTPADVSGQELSLQGAHDDVAARDECANRAGANVLVGIYFDSGGSAQDAGSLTAYDADRPFAASNLRLANLVQHDVLAAMNAQGWGIPNAGVTPDSSVGSLVTGTPSTGLAAEAAAYGHLLLLGPAAAGFLSTPSTMPGTVVEPLFITDPFEASIAASPHGQAVMAAGIAEAVEQYFAPSRPTTTAPAHPG
jgi:N-acetylmuramoyl-L-alanine amidase